MSILAGTVLHVGGNNIIDRIQSAGLGNAKVPVEVIREVGNLNIVDKVPGEPDFTFTLQSFDVSTEVEAWLTGEVGDGTIAGAPGATDAAGTAYPIDAVHCQFVNITSPWRNPLSSAGSIQAGHIVPGFYPTRVRYQFGVKANSDITVELAGASYYYNGNPPVEQYATGDGTTVAFTTSNPAVPYREGGQGSLFRSIFGVIVNGVLQTQNVDFTTTPTNTAAAGTASITFSVAPVSGAVIKFCYFTTAARAYPTALNASSVVKPAAVRGRNICVFLGSGGAATQIGNVQSATLEYTVQGQVERELCSSDVVGYTVLGTDVQGDFSVRVRDINQLLGLLSKVTGVSSAEVIGYLNTNAIPLSIKIQNPKNPTQYLKSLYVSDAVFDIPDTSTKVNQPVDFSFTYQSRTGTFQVFKGDSGF